jgi:hypothetical protein
MVHYRHGQRQNEAFNGILEFPNLSTLADASHHLLALSTAMTLVMPKLMHHMLDAYVVQDRKLLWLVSNYQP